MGKIILRLDRVMVERQMSLGDLANHVGITNANMSKIKNNKVTAIRFSTLEKICEVLECTPGDIIEFENSNAEDK
ncbi:helix-turn-helix transcriptional regulator [Mollicutes bacterium LVI A0039]|nr:helix-turn-helix transcriptional regulator [Mollicutes bacterium LVI A0039]